MEAEREDTLDTQDTHGTTTPRHRSMSTILDSLVTGGTLMAITSCSFFLGLLYSDWPYTHFLLWAAEPENADKVAKLALQHYVHWLDVPKFIPFTMYGVLLFGFLGFTMKVFKPAEDVKYFEYGSFAVYVLAVCCYASNVRFGVYSAQAGEWGDVDEFTGLSVIAASEVIIVFLLLGIVVIQSGIFFAKYEDDRVKAAFLMKELKVKLAQAEAQAKKGGVAAAASSGRASGSAKGETAGSVNKKK